MTRPKSPHFERRTAQDVELEGILGPAIPNGSLEIAENLVDNALISKAC